MNPISLTIDEACKQTGIGRTKLYELLRSGEIKRRKLGQRTLILSDELKAYVTALPDGGSSAKNGGAD